MQEVQYCIPHDTVDMYRYYNEKQCINLIIYSVKNIYTYKVIVIT